MKCLSHHQHTQIDVATDKNYGGWTYRCSNSFASLCCFFLLAQYLSRHKNDCMLEKTKQRSPRMRSFSTGMKGVYLLSVALTFENAKNRVGIAAIRLKGDPERLNRAVKYRVFRKPKVSGHLNSGLLSASFTTSPPMYASIHAW
eukprot:COSAG02_NODE_12975_length_1465_cov_36.122255_2_plen_144_part_00